MSIDLELPPELASQLAAEAAQLGLSLNKRLLPNLGRVGESLANRP